MPEKTQPNDQELERIEIKDRRLWLGVTGLLLAGCCLTTAATGVLAMTRPVSGSVSDIRINMGPHGAIVFGNKVPDFVLHASYNNPADPTFANFDLRIGPNTLGVSAHSHLVVNDADPAQNGYEWEWGGRWP